MRSSSNYRGLVLLLVTAVSALWLGSTNQLALYIHPRYVTLTIVFAVVAVLLAIAVGKYAGSSDADEEHTPSESAGRWRWLGHATMTVCLLGSAALIAVKPAVLTSATASQRGVNAAAVGTSGDAVLPTESPLFGGNNYDNLSIGDWSSLLSQVDDPEYFAGKSVDLTGFVVPDERDAKNVFYVSRFVVTCCAVDARPVGVPVHLPGWRERFEQDQWVKVTGSFVASPSVLATHNVAISVGQIEAIAEPEQPYDF